MDLVQLNPLFWKVGDLNLAFLDLFNQLIFPGGLAVRIGLGLDALFKQLFSFIQTVKRPRPLPIAPLSFTTLYSPSAASIQMR